VYNVYLNVYPSGQQRPLFLIRSGSHALVAADDEVVGKLRLPVEGERGFDLVHGAIARQRAAVTLVQHRHEDVEARAAGGEQVAAAHLQEQTAERRHHLRRTAMQKLRIVILGFGTW
jgi:uncharacterized protein YigA (DUF484 family)